MNDLGEGRRNEEFELFDQLYARLRRFAAVVADLDVDPDDLVHDALAATLGRCALSDLDDPSAYLKRSILNASSNHRRRRATARRFLPRLAGPTVTVDDYPSDLSVIDRLAPTDRAVIFLADVEGLGHAAIAQELGLSAAAVRKRASRARARLRRELGGTEPARDNEPRVDLVEHDVSRTGED